MKVQAGVLLQLFSVAFCLFFTLASSRSLREGKQPLLCRHGVQIPFLSEDPQVKIRFDQLLQNTRNKKNLKQTTDIDWEKLCEELCASGDGGDLCNCEIHPFKHKALEFARKPKASEDTDIDWDQVCKELCASGDGGDLCNCEIHLKALDFARKPKASEDTDIDWDQVCKELCASGDGGDLCNCEIHPFKHKALETESSQNKAQMKKILKRKLQIKQILKRSRH